MTDESPEKKPSPGAPLLTWFTDHLHPAQVLVPWFPLGILLFAPENWIDALGLSEFKTEYQLWFGIGFLLTSSALFVAGLVWVWKRLSTWRDIRRGQKSLHDLTPDEKAILHRFISENRRSLPLPAMSGITAVLVARVIIVRASILGRPGGSMLLDYVIQPWAWDYLRKHPELVTPEPNPDPQTPEPTYRTPRAAPRS